MKSVPFRAEMDRQSNVVKNVAVQGQADDDGEREPEHTEDDKGGQAAAR